MLLAIDTATQYSSIALHDGETLRGEFTWEAVNRHTVTLLPHITDLLHETGITAENLSAVAVCIGPGSYTGVRIGMSVAQGLAITRHLPLVGFQTVEILVAAQPPDTRALYAIFAAGRRRIGYVRCRWQETHWAVESELQVGTWEEFVAQIHEPALVVGEISAMGREILGTLHDRVMIPPPAYHLRRAGYLADLAWQQLRTGYQGDPTRLTPLYAR